MDSKSYHIQDFDCCKSCKYFAILNGFLGTYDLCDRKGKDTVDPFGICKKYKRRIGDNDQSRVKP